MTATAHALIAGAIVTAVPNPAIGIPLVAISHPIADMIPHWDFGVGWRSKNKILLFLESSADLIFGITITYLLFGSNVNNVYLFLAIFISESWDLLQAPYWLFGWKCFPFSAFYHFGKETNGKAGMPWGIVTQVASVASLVLALRILR